MTVLPSQLEIDEHTTRNILSELHTCMPGEVVAVRSSGTDKRQFVDVLPMLKRAVVDEDGEPLDEALPVLQMVPVGYMQGGGFFLSVPLRVGDVVLLVFAERSLDAWIQNAKPGARSPVTPGDLSTHTLQGAIALPCGPRPRAALLTGVDAADMVVATESGTVLARFKADGSVTFAEGVGTDFVGLAGKIMTALNKLQSKFDAHTHPAVTTATVGVSGPATVTVSAPSSPVGPLDDVAATKTKAT